MKNIVVANWAAREGYSYSGCSLFKGKKPIRTINTMDKNKVVWIGGDVTDPKSARCVATFDYNEFERLTGFNIDIKPGQCKRIRLELSL